MKIEPDWEDTVLIWLLVVLVGALSFGLAETLAQGYGFHAYAYAPSLQGLNAVVRW